MMNYEERVLAYIDILGYGAVIVKILKNVLIAKK